MYGTVIDQRFNGTIDLLEFEVKAVKSVVPSTCMFPFKYLDNISVSLADRRDRRDTERALPLR